MVTAKLHSLTGPKCCTTFFKCRNQ
jgi:hypothetical protein